MAEPTSTFFQSDQVDQQPHRHTLLVRLVGYLKPYWPGLVALLLLMAAGAVLDVLPSEFTLRLIDRYLAQGSMRGAGPLVAAFLGFVILGFVVQTARFALLAWVGQRAMLDLRLQVFSHLMRRSTHFFHRNPVGRLMTRVISDVQNLNEMFSSGFVAIVGDALSLTAIVVWMFSKHRGLALVAVGIMPLLLLATEIFRRYASAAYRETQGRYAAIQAFLQEQLSGMALVQMNAREEQSRRLFRDFNQKYLDAFLRTIFAYAVFFPVVEFITNGTLAALIFYAGFKLQLGTLTLGLLLAFIQQSGRFFRPIRELAERYNVMQTALASSERIFKLLDNTDQIPEAAEPEPVTFHGEIRLEGVGFAYEAGGRKVVRGLSGVIPKGRRVAVVGHTGAGKSTLINLLMRFYDVEEGRITVDGVDLREARLEGSARPVRAGAAGRVHLLRDAARRTSPWAGRMDAAAAGSRCWSRASWTTWWAGCPGPADPGGRARPETRRRRTAAAGLRPDALPGTGRAAAGRGHRQHRQRDRAQDPDRSSSG